MGRRRSRVTKAEADALAPVVAVAVACAAWAAPFYFIAEWSLACTVLVALILVGGLVAVVVGHLRKAEKPRLAQFSAAILRRPVLALPALALAAIGLFWGRANGMEREQGERAAAAASAREVARRAAEQAEADRFNALSPDAHVAQAGALIKAGDCTAAKRHLAAIPQHAARAEVVALRSECSARSNRAHLIAAKENIDAAASETGPAALAKYKVADEELAAVDREVPGSTTEANLLGEALGAGRSREGLRLAQLALAADDVAAAERHLGLVRADSTEAEAAAKLKKQVAVKRRQDEQRKRAEERRERARQAREESANRSLKCCDGSLSPTCSCSGSHRGCCSHHGGVCGCE